VCPQPGCGKAFSAAGDTAKHLRTHTDVRTYACRQLGCGKAFSEAGNRNKHERRVHSSGRV
jgi:uncharacterized Zn-finger protein